MRIERGPGSALRRARRWPWMLGAAAILALAGCRRAPGRRLPRTSRLPPSATAYPYQAVTLLNAAGYVVAQRKAAVSSKATGRLEWLGVQEGQRVKEGEVIARLENRDVRAAGRAGTGQRRGGRAPTSAQARGRAAATPRPRCGARSDLLAQQLHRRSPPLDTAEARHDQGATRRSAAPRRARGGAEASRARRRGRGRTRR
ncbi:MAG: biotin/lipoyl-binding protein [Comamonadaceae bacterium]|nr:biotin/lipoyl-binding protein [Comamonadaceae bacterium]